MPQLMPLNWMFSLFMVGFLLVICFYLFFFNSQILSFVFEDVNNDSNWLW